MATSKKPFEDPLEDAIRRQDAALVQEAEEEEQFGPRRTPFHHRYLDNPPKFMSDNWVFLVLLGYPVLFFLAFYGQHGAFIPIRSIVYCLGAAVAFYLIVKRRF